MDRAYSSGAAGTPPSVPVSPSAGYPSSGNPVGPVQPTKPGAYWYHMVMEELMAVIVAGAITPAIGTLTQLRDALYALFGRLAVKNIWTKANVAAEQALPATTGTVTLDLALGNNFGGTLTGNITLANPSNMAVGQSGVIRITNDASPRTIAYGSYWKAAGGAMPALTAVAGAVEVFGYYVESASRITLVVQQDVK